MQLFKNKKIILIVGLIIAAGIVGLLITSSRSEETEPTAEEPEKRRITEPVNEIPVTERPYVSIQPLADGRHLILNVNHLNKPAQKVDYELEYQAGTMLQMIMGTIQIDNLPVSKQELLGTCSAGGACTYHEDVSGGTLLLRFTIDSGDTYAVKSDWRYFDNSTGSDEAASRDAKFQLTAPALANQRYIIVYNSPGCPEGLEQEPISENFSLSSAAGLTGQGELIIRTNEKSDSAVIMGYDGTDWTEFETNVDGREVSAEVELMDFYTVVNKTAD